MGMWNAAQCRKSKTNKEQENNKMRQENAEMEKIMKKQALAKDNRGIGVVEIILILVILIGLVLIFQTQIKEIVNSALDTINSGAEKVTL